MKKMVQWVMAATLVCGASVFTSCTSDTVDNPVQPEGAYPVTVKEGGEVTPKVAVSPGFASEGETVTLTALHGYKFRSVVVDDAPVTYEDNGRLVISMALLSVPYAWNNDTTPLTADDLPGFKPVTKEVAAQWEPTESDKEDYGAFLIYGFDEGGSVYMYVTPLTDGNPIIEVAGEKMPRNYSGLFGTIRTSPAKFYYPCGATVVGDKTVATFRMPAGAASVDCDMMRDISVDVTATPSAAEFGLKKEGEGFVLTEGEGLTAILPDVYDEIGAPLVSMQEDIDYVLTLQKYEARIDLWNDTKELSEGTFRWQLRGIGIYDGFMTSAPFTLSVVGE